MAQTGKFGRGSNVNCRVMPYTALHCAAGHLQELLHNSLVKRMLQVCYRGLKVGYTHVIGVSQRCYKCIRGSYTHVTEGCSKDVIGGVKGW